MVDQSRMLVTFADELADQILSAWPPFAPVKPVLSSLFGQAMTGICAGTARFGSPVTIQQLVTCLAQGAKPNDIPHAAARNLGSALLEMAPLGLAATASGIVGGGLMSSAPGPTLTITKAPPDLTSPSRWVKEEVIRWIRRLGGPAGQLAKRELQEIPDRLEAAAGIQAAATLAPFINSNPNVGKAVHQKLQEDYRKAPLMMENLLSVDRKIWGKKGGQAFSGEGLRDAALTSGIPELHAAYYAWAKTDAFLESYLSVLRSDVTNFTHMNSGLIAAPAPGIAGYGENWEIKPMGRAVSGVLQEAFYRLYYNWVRLTMEYDGPRPLTAEVRPGVHWPGVMLGQAIPVNDSEVSFAIPFTAPRILPGLLLYAPVRGLTLYEVEQLSVLLAKLLKKTLEEIGKIYEEIRKAIDKVLIWASELIMCFLKVLAILAGFILLAVGLAALGNIIIAGAPAGALAGIIILIVLGSKGARNKPPQQQPEFPNGLSLSFGAVAADVSAPLTAQQVAQLFTTYTSAFVSGLRSLCEGMSPVV
jgi:hypothetical protein